MRIAVIGLGKIGLPLAVQYAGRGHQVIGVDIDRRVVDLVNQGREPFPGEHDLGPRLSRSVAEGALSASDDYAVVADCEAVVVVVPLVVDQVRWEPDFSVLDAATRSLARHLGRGTLVSYETTLPVGTTRSRWRPMLEQLSGLVEGEDFHLVFSPERVLTGRVFSDLSRYPKLVGALNPAGARHGVAFYESVLTFDPRDDLPRPNGVWDLGSAEAAEMTKLAETTYRDVNIALVNQFARFADRSGLDIRQVVEAANSQPFSHLHQPGVAVGGHCIPVYPRLYLWGDPEASVVRTAREANLQMPGYAVGLARGALGELTGLRAVVLGAAYRGGVKETAFSGVFDLVDELETAGATVSVHDPMYSDAELATHGWRPHHIGEPAEVAIVQADHEEYRTLTPADVPGVRVLVDGRDITAAQEWREVPRLVIGRGDSSADDPDLLAATGAGTAD